MRDVQVDAALEVRFERLRQQGPAACEVGLLLGCSNDSRSLDIIIAIAPTPTRPFNSSNNSSNTLPPPSHILNAPWITEHALQAHKVLPVGAHVLGVYVYAPSAASPDASDIATAVIQGLLVRGNDQYYASCSFLVMSRRKMDSPLACFEARTTASAPSSSFEFSQAPLVPAPFRYVPNAASQVARVECDIRVDISFALPPLPSTNANKLNTSEFAVEYTKSLISGLRSAAQRTAGAESVLLCDGLPVSLSASPVGDQILEMQALFPGAGATSGVSTATGTKQIPGTGAAGVACVRGSVTCVACVTDSHSFEDARLLLMEDLCRTLTARVHLAADDLRDDEDEDQPSPALELFRDTRALPFGRRMFGKFAGVVPCCEYLFAGDDNNIEAALRTWKEILGVDVSRDDVSMRERDPLDTALVGLPKSSCSLLINGAVDSSKSRSNRAQSSPTGPAKATGMSMYILAALAAVLLAIVVSLFSGSG